MSKKHLKISQRAQRTDRRSCPCHSIKISLHAFLFRVECLHFGDYSLSVHLAKELLSFLNIPDFITIASPTSNQPAEVPF
jgi:hypothetical protein